jgi:hypothetical protein
MFKKINWFLVAFILAAGATVLFSQESQSQSTAASNSGTSAPAPMPRLVHFGGTVPDATAGELVTLKFALYEAQTGGDAVWQESQQVTLGESGKYSVLLGSATENGLPQGMFSAAQAKWLGVTVGDGQEMPRTILVSTPYSLKASDSETLGGHPASDFQLAAKKDTSGKPDTLTDITTISGSNGVLVNTASNSSGTGPTVALSLDPTYLEALGNEIYPQLGATNVLTGKNTYTAGNLLLGTSPVLSVANVLAGADVIVTPSGNTVSIGINGPALLTLANPYYAQLAAANSFAGTQTLAATGTATSSKGYDSNALKFSGSAYNSTSSSAEAVNFAWQAEPAGNDTATPSGTMNLLYSTGTNAPAETGLSVASNGKINFATGQTFPGTGTGNGTITGITTSSPLSGSGTSGSVALSLNTTTLETTLDTIYPQLSASNAFTGVETMTSNSAFGSPLTALNTSTEGGYGLQAQGLNGVSATGSSTAGTGVVGTGLVGVEAIGSATATNSTFPAGWGLGVEASGLIGVYGTTTYTGIGGVGVYAYAPATSADSVGVYGESDANGGAGGSFTGEDSGTSSGVNGTGILALGYTGAQIYGDEVVGTGLSATGATAIHATSITETSYGSGVYNDNGTAIAATGGSSYTVVAGTNGITAGIGVNASGYYGVSATGGNAGVTSTGGSYGVYGGSNGSGGTGVEGYGDTGSGYGLYGTGATGVYGNGLNGQGVFGTTALTGGPAGIYGQSTATTVGSDGYPGIGISGNASGPSSWGVYGNSTDADGIGVYGNAATGVLAVGTFEGLAATTSGPTNANLMEGYAVIGQMSTGFSETGEDFVFSDSSAGVWGDMANGNGGGSGVLATADSDSALIAANNSEYAALKVYNYTTATHDPVFETYSPNTYSNARSCIIDTSANLTCTGLLTGVVPIEGGKDAAMYSVQSAENWFEDAGSGQLASGSAHVSLEPMFGQAVNTGVEYHVFLTPNGDCRGLYVSSKSDNGFEVRELGGGRSNISFDYRIMAKRKGYETVRMEDLTEQTNARLAREAARKERAASHAGRLPKPAVLPTRPPTMLLPVAHEKQPHPAPPVPEVRRKLPKLPAHGTAPVQTRPGTNGQRAAVEAPNSGPNKELPK